MLALGRVASDRIGSDPLRPAGIRLVSIHLAGTVPTDERGLAWRKMLLICFRFAPCPGCRNKRLAVHVNQAQTTTTNCNVNTRVVVASSSSSGGGVGVGALLLLLLSGCIIIQNGAARRLLGLALRACRALIEYLAAGLPSVCCATTRAATLKVVIVRVQMIFSVASWVCCNLASGWPAGWHH